MIRVLAYVQSFDADVSIINHIDSTGIGECDLVRGNLELFLKKLKEKSYDVLLFISDSTHFDIKIINQIKETFLPLPLLIVLDRVDDKIRKKLIKIGVKDVLTKEEARAPSLTKLFLKAIKGNRVTKERSDLLEIIEKGEKFWLTVFDNLPEFSLIINERGTIERCNKPFARLFDKHPRDLVGKVAKEYLPFSFVKNFDSKDLPAYLEEEFGDRHYYITVTKFTFEGNQKILFFFKDITEYERIKQHLYQVDKLSSIGTLASGIAHEINNPLTGIIGYAQMLKMVAGCSENKDILDKILECADRCKKIVESLLIYSRQRPSTKSLETINNIVERTIDLVSYNLRKNNIVIEKELGDTPVMLIDNQQIQQALINIILNAQDAILLAKRGRGEIKISTFFDKQANKVYLKVSDNGIGIKKDIIHKIFDPFFTTKAFGEAMGLGLSIAYGIVKEHRGNISVESKEGIGTTFVIELPIEF